jgi:hypothetical protein
MAWLRRGRPKSPGSRADGGSAGSTPLYLGLPGLTGNEARRTIPGMLFHCPGVLLLHDPIYVAEELFQVDTDNILETTQYRLALRLVERGRLKTLPRCDGAFEADLQNELADLTGEFLGRLGLSVPREAVVDWGNHADGHDLARLCPPERRQMVIHTTDLLRDVCWTQAIAERLGCPYAFPLEDDVVYSVRWSMSGRSADHQVHAVLRVPIPEGSLLVTDTGEPATILPEIAYTMERAMNGQVWLRDEKGHETPYVEPSWHRSSEMLDRVLQARECEALMELRVLLAEWYRTLRELTTLEQSAMEQLQEAYEERLERLLPHWAPSYRELGRAMGTQRVTVVQCVPQEVPAPTSPTRRTSPEKEASPVLFYPEYFGPTGTWASPELRIRRR